MRKVQVLLFALLLPVATFAGEGSVTLPYLAQNLNPASAAMGSISLFDNAASSVLSSGRGHVQAGYGLWNPSESKDIFLDAHCMLGSKAALRLEAADRMETPYDMTDEFGEPAGQFTPSSMRALLGASFKLGGHFAVGADAVYARRTLYEDATYSTIAGNAALMMRFGAFNAAVGGRNMGIAVSNAEGNGRFNTPGSAFADLGLDILKGKHEIIFGGEFEYLFFNAIAYGAGASYTYNDIISVRGGYHSGGLFPTHFSAGIGLKFFGVTLNATALLGNDLMNGTFLFGLGYSF